jgi:cyclic lactone autoinducer peptide
MGIRKAAAKAVGTIAAKAAQKNANELCAWWAYQPKVPEAVKKLRKF